MHGTTIRLGNFYLNDALSSPQPFWCGISVSNFYLNDALSSPQPFWCGISVSNFYLTDALSSPQPFWCGISVSNVRAMGQAVSRVLSTRGPGSIPGQSM